MGSSSPHRGTSEERGAVLAVVLIFSFLVLLSAFSAAVVSRTHLRVANTVETSAEAFYVAEAGVAEVLWRLNRSSAANVTVDGNTFDARIVPDPAVSTWKTEIVFDATGNTVSGTTRRTPSIQPAANRLAYSANAGAESPLTIEWAIDPSTGNIRQVAGRDVLQIHSVGRSGAARRRVQTYASGGTASAGYIVLQNLAKSVILSGSASLTLPGTMQVNSSFTNAISTSGSAGIVAAQPVNVHGASPGCTGSCNVLPSVNAGAPVVPDPLATVAAPTRPPPGMPVFTASSWPTNTTIQPGYYPNGIGVSGGATLKLAGGLYVLGPGTEFRNSSSTITGLGPVTIYADRFTMSGGSGSMTMRAPSVAEAAGAGFFGYPYKGILFFQARSSTEILTFSGGSAGNLDGLIYCTQCEFVLSGGSTGLGVEFVIGELTVTGPSSISTPTNPVLSGGGGYQTLGWANF